MTYTHTHTHAELGGAQIYCRKSDRRVKYRASKNTPSQ